MAPSVTGGGPSSPVTKRKFLSMELGLCTSIFSERRRRSGWKSKGAPTDYNFSVVEKKNNCKKVARNQKTVFFFPNNFTQWKRRKKKKKKSLQHLSSCEEEMATAEYLKRYLNPEPTEKKKRTKKKKLSARVKKVEGLKIVDHDFKAPAKARLAKEEDEESEDELPVVIDIDEQPLHSRPAQGSTSGWVTVSDSNATDASPPRRTRHDTPSPPRRQNEATSSPPRRKRHDTPSPPRHQSEATSSPPRRKRHDSPSSSPPRRMRHDTPSPTSSPPRKRALSPTSASPPRKRRNVPSSSTVPANVYFPIT